MYASAAGHREALQMILAQEPRSPLEDTSRKEARQQALVTAVHYDDVEIVSFLAEVCDLLLTQ